MMKMLPALLLLAGALAKAAPAAEEPFSAAAPCPGCNVVLVSFDALQAAHVHALGYPRQTTPTIDRLAGQGVLFTQAVTPAPWTLPAHMSWFTGTYPSLHKVVNKFVFESGRLVPSNLQNLAPGTQTLAEALRGRGYATGGFTGGAGVSGI